MLVSRKGLVALSQFFLLSLFDGRNAGAKIPVQVARRGGCLISKPDQCCLPKAA